MGLGGMLVVGLVGFMLVGLVGFGIYSMMGGGNGGGCDSGSSTTNTAITLPGGNKLHRRNNKLFTKLEDCSSSSDSDSDSGSDSDSDSAFSTDVVGGDDVEQDINLMIAADRVTSGTLTCDSGPDGATVNSVSNDINSKFAFIKVNQQTLNSNCADDGAMSKCKKWKTVKVNKVHNCSSVSINNFSLNQNY